MTKHKKHYKKFGTKKTGRKMAEGAPFTFPPEADADFIAHVKANYYVNGVFFTRPKGELISCEFYLLKTEEIIFSETMGLLDEKNPSLQDCLAAVMAIAAEANILNDTDMRVMVIALDDDPEDFHFILLPKKVEIVDPNELINAFHAHVFRIIQRQGDGNDEPIQ